MAKRPRLKRSQSITRLFEPYEVPAAISKLSTKDHAELGRQLKLIMLPMQKQMFRCLNTKILFPLSNRLRLEVGDLEQLFTAHGPQLPEMLDKMPTKNLRVIRQEVQLQAERCLEMYKKHQRQLPLEATIIGHIRQRFLNILEIIDELINDRIQLPETPL